MSTYADSSKAALWLDGDAFRGAANATRPTDVFAPSLVDFDAFGGIQAGFTVTPSQEVTELEVWNNESGAPYYVSKKPVSAEFKFRPVDMSKATALTLLSGGSIAETEPASGQWLWTPGADEEFSLIMRLISGTKKKVYFLPRATLSTPPEEVMNDEALEGWDLVIKPLAPSGGAQAIQKITNTNPLA